MTFERRNSAILSRASVLDLIEQLPEDLARAHRNLAADPVQAEAIGSLGFLDRWTVRDYEVRRFGNWCFCTCDGFGFSGKACRHIAATFPPTCAKCGTRSVAARGDICNNCAERSAPYLKPASGRTTTKIGNIRI